MPGILSRLTGRGRARVGPVAPAPRADSDTGWGVPQAQLDSAFEALVDDPDWACSQGALGVCGRSAVVHAAVTRAPERVKQILDVVHKAGAPLVPVEAREQRPWQVGQHNLAHYMLVTALANRSNALLPYRAQLKGGLMDLWAGATGLRTLKRMMAIMLGIDKARTRVNLPGRAVSGIVDDFNKRFSYSRTAAIMGINAKRLDSSDPIASYQWDQRGFHKGNRTVQSAAEALTGYPHAVEVRSRILKADDGDGYRFIAFNPASGETSKYELGKKAFEKGLLSLTSGDIPGPEAPVRAADDPEQLAEEAALFARTPTTFQRTMGWSPT